MCNQNPLDVAIEYGEHPYFSGKHMSKHEKKCALRAKKEARAYNFFEKHVVMRSTLETIDLFFSVFVVIATIVLFVTMLFNFTIYVDHPPPCCFTCCLFSTIHWSVDSYGFTLAW